MSTKAKLIAYRWISRPRNSILAVFSRKTNKIAVTTCKPRRILIRTWELWLVLACLENSIFQAETLVEIPEDTSQECLGLVPMLIRLMQVTSSFLTRVASVVAPPMLLASVVLLTPSPISAPQVLVLLPQWISVPTKSIFLVAWQKTLVPVPNKRNLRNPSLHHSKHRKTKLMTWMSPILT